MLTAECCFCKKEHSFNDSTRIGNFLWCPSCVTLTCGSKKKLIVQKLKEIIKIILS